MIARSRLAGWSLSAVLVVFTACSDEPTAPARGTPVGPPVADLLPGTTVFGTNEYVEYLPGDLPLIFSAPHGGALEPAGIPERVEGAGCGPEVTTVRDLNTQELARTIRDAFFARTGRYPHVIINRLHRNRLDANRAIGEAACGNAEAELAWNEYQQFVETAKAAVVAQHGRGWFTDVHGHGHTIQRLELGYELSGTTLRRPDAQLDGTATYEQSSSIRSFSEDSPLSFSALLRGPTALGTLFAEAGYPSVPSAQDPAPNVGESYFSGGYNTDRHACSRGGSICGVQIEANLTGVRNTAANRGAFAAALVDVYREYLAPFGITIPVAPRPGVGEALVIDNDNTFNNSAWARFEASSSWTSGSNSQAWGANFQLSSGNASATNDGAEFFFYIASPGTYTVDAWWPALSSRSPSASYRVFELDGGARLADLKLDQRTNGARWNPLGTYKFTQVGWAKVLISRSLSATGSLAADAIRVTQDNIAPRVSLAGDATILQGETFTVGGSIVDPDDESWTAAVSFGDGSAAESHTVGSTFAIGHRYVAAGEFTATVRVSDGTDEATSGVVVTVLSPVAAVSQLIADVHALGAAGKVAEGRVNGLRAPLEAALRQLERGNATAASGQLGAFANQCNALVNAGELSSADAAELRELAERIATSARG